MFAFVLAVFCCVLVLCLVEEAEMCEKDWFRSSAQDEEALEGEDLLVLLLFTYNN